MAEVHVLSKYKANPYGGISVDTTYSSGKWRDLSPFALGPIILPHIFSENFENLWQYSKVYESHVGEDGEPTAGWYRWRYKGLLSALAHRYPMGKNRIPLYSYWNGEKLSYIEARKRIYAPLYAQFVAKTESYFLLERLYQNVDVLVLRDYDAYDHIAFGMGYGEVINDSTRKMGHAFVLAMMLTGARVWPESK